jgi:hypothetical protein
VPQTVSTFIAKPGQPTGAFSSFDGRLVVNLDRAHDGSHRVFVDVGALGIGENGNEVPVAVMGKTHGVEVE